MIFDTERIENDKEYRNSMRFRCETDHFFLAPLMGFHDFNRRIHQPAVDLYFPKNRALPIEDQHRIKNRLHLDPRYTLKTSLGRVDSVQWILAFPELISILNESATQPLAAAISTKTAEYFWCPKGRPQTVLQKLYPELVTDRKPDATWDTPNRRPGELDSTLSFTSPRTQQSGWHPWILSPDDMCDAVNSGLHASDPVRESVKDTYYTNKNTLRPGGYLNVRGTRYHPFDLYGDIIEKMDPDEWRVLIRSSLTVRDGSRLVPGDFPREEDVDLHFPELPNLTYKSLKTIYYESYESFMSQQQNDPQGGNVATFDEKLYKSCIVEDERIPLLGDTVMCWRLQYGGKAFTAKYAEGAVARITPGRIFILDAWQGIYTPTTLAEKIIKESRRYQVNGLMMEDLPGTQYMQQHILNESYRKNYPIHLQWLPYDENDFDRIGRMRQVEPVMRSGRLGISSAIGKATETRQQFLNFLLVVENGILDCISRLIEKMPLTLLRSAMDQEEIEYQQRRREDEQFKAIFGIQGQQMLDEEMRRQMDAHMGAMEEVNCFGLPPMPGGLDG